MWTFRGTGKALVRLSRWVHVTEDVAGRCGEGRAVQTEAA